MTGSKLFARTALFTVALALVVVVAGAYVRLSHAGLSCPDWPGCYGRALAPAGEDAAARAARAYPDRPLDSARAWKEMIHRYLAGLLGLVIVFMALLAYRRRRAPGQQVALPVTIVGLVIFQALLGMWTVTLLLKPLIVVAHLLGGLATASLCWWVYLRHRDGYLRPTPNGASVPPMARRLAAGAIVVVAAQASLGGWTSANYAALACVDFPLCQGALWPQMSFSEGFLLWRGVGPSYEGGVLAGDARVAIHVTHRLGALVTLLYLGGFAVFLMRARLNRMLAKAAGIMLLALLAQIALGIANVLAHLPLFVAVAHNGVAALLLLSTITVYHMSAPRRARLGAPMMPAAAAGDNQPAPERMS